VLGTLFVNLGATTGATLAFLVSRYLLRDWVEQKFGKWLGPVQLGFAKNAFGYLMTLRLIPLFPFFVVNLVSGLTRMNVGIYVVATALELFPGSFVYAYAGRQLGTINSFEDIVSPGDWSICIAGASGACAKPHKKWSETSMTPSVKRPRLARDVVSNREAYVKRRRKEGATMVSQSAEERIVVMNQHEESLVLPNDEHNRMLVSNVHPSTGSIPNRLAANIVVIGAGTAGIDHSRHCCEFGGQSGLDRKNMMGGDCLNVGCVPRRHHSRGKSLGRLRNAEEFGLHIPPG
jgi:hypothetical protein